MSSRSREMLVPACEFGLVRHDRGMKMKREHPQYLLDVRIEQAFTVSAFLRPIDL